MIIMIHSFLPFCGSFVFLFSFRHNSVYDIYTYTHKHRHSTSHRLQSRGMKSFYDLWVLEHYGKSSSCSLIHCSTHPTPSPTPRNPVIWCYKKIFFLTWTAAGAWAGQTEVHMFAGLLALCMTSAIRDCKVRL